MRWANVLVESNPYTAKAITQLINMKIYLDDERQTPEGWARVYWPDEAIRLLETGKSHPDQS